jgi:hypothetical protein
LRHISPADLNLIIWEKQEQGKVNKKACRFDTHRLFYTIA